MLLLLQWSRLQCGFSLHAVGYVCSDGSICCLNLVWTSIIRHYPRIDDLFRIVKSLCKADDSWFSITILSNKSNSLQKISNYLKFNHMQTKWPICLVWNTATGGGQAQVLEILNIWPSLMPEADMFEYNISTYGWWCHAILAAPVNFRLAFKNFKYWSCGTLGFVGVWSHGRGFETPKAEIVNAMKTFKTIQIQIKTKIKKKPLFGAWTK